MALVKTGADIVKLRTAGTLLGDVLEEACGKAVHGTVLRDLDVLIERRIRASGATPSFLHYDGFPASCCLSLNAEVVHGVPDGRELKEGDVLGIDVGLWLGGVVVDAARTVVIGANWEGERLVLGTWKALHAGISAAKAFRRVGSISQAIQASAESQGFGIVRALTGHGVGHAVHEEPEVPNYGHASDGMVLRPGMVICIEPMLTLGGGEVHVEVDGWTVVASDGSLAAQQEETVLITKAGAEVLTRPAR